jgi:hypothetical protein
MLYSPSVLLPEVTGEPLSCVRPPVISSMANIETVLIPLLTYAP